MDGGVIGGIVGTVVGIAGGVLGTYFSIRNTRGPRERAFMIRASLGVWVALGLFLAGLLAIPQPYNLGLWLPYAILLPLGIRYINRRQSTIRSEEAAG